MKTKKIKANDGYVLNKETGKLEKYEFIDARFTFHPDNKPIYRCKLGGKETILEDDFEVYPNEEAFTQGKKCYSDREVYISRSGLKYSINTAWYFENGDAVPVDADNIAMIYDNANKLKFADDLKYYNTRNEVFLNNDYIVVDENGNETIHECYNSKIKLTDKQNELLDKLSELIQEIENNQIELLYDRCYDKLRAFNRANITIENRYQDCMGEDGCDALLLDNVRTLNEINSCCSDDCAVEIR